MNRSWKLPPGRRKLWIGDMYSLPYIRQLHEIARQTVYRPFDRLPARDSSPFGPQSLLY